MQPTYLPWRGYFDLIQDADTFVLLDNVQFSPQSWQQRNRIRQPDGRLHWLTVPVKKPHLQPLNQIEIDHGRDWQRKHWASIQLSYHKQPGWQRLHRLLEPVYTSHAWQHLADLNAELIHLLAREQGITTPIRRASRLPLFHTDQRGRLVEICRHFNADAYLTTRGATYLDGLTQLAPGLPIVWFDYPDYPEPHLSVIDDLARDFTTAEVSSTL